MYASSSFRVSVAVSLWLGVIVLMAAETPSEPEKETPPKAGAEAPAQSTLKMLLQPAAEPTPEAESEEPTEEKTAEEKTAEEKPAEATAESASGNPGETPQDVYTVAIGHYSGSRWRLAVEEFSRFLQLYPNHANAPLALFFRAEAHMQQGLYAAARQDFADFVAREPGHRYVPQASFRTAEAVYLTGDTKTAREELERFTTAYPNDDLNAYAKAYLAELALAARDGPRAAGLFKEVLERHPDGTHVAQCRFGLGRAAELQGDLDSARIAYQTLAAAGGVLADDAQVQLGICLYNRGKYTEAETSLQAAIEQYPESELLAQARYWLGMSQVARQDWDHAVATLQSALDQHPQDALTPAMAFWQAEAYRQRGDSETAQKGYEQVWRSWPDSEYADDSLQVQLQLAIGDAQYPQVLSLAERFLTQFPDSPRKPYAEQCLARAHLKLKQYGPSIDILKRLIAAASPANLAVADGDPDAPQAASVTLSDESQMLQANQYYLAIAYLGDGQPQAGLDLLAKLPVTPDNKELYGGVQLANAIALVALNRRPDAIEILQKYLATEPAGEDVAACRLQLAEWLVQDKRLDEALQLHAQIAGKEVQQPSYLETTHLLAEAALESGKHAEAIRLFSVLTEDGQPPALAEKGWAGLGWTNFRAGNMEPANVAFSRLIEQYPASPLAAEAALMKGKTLEQIGRHEDALEAYLLVVTTYDKSEQAAPALFAAARLQEQLGRKAEAIPLLRRLVQEYPNDKLLDGVLYQLAWLLFDQGQPDEADRLFQRITAEYPDSEFWADATYRLAQRATTAKQYEQARQFADQLTADNCEPEILEHALFLQGQLAAFTQRWQDAVIPLQALLERFPDSSLNGAAEFWMAEAFYQQKEYGEAAKWFGKLKAELLVEQPTWAPLTVLRRAQIMAEQGEWQEAYDLANGIEPQYPQFVQQYEADCLLGRCLARQRKNAAALQRYERVIRSPEGGRTETAAMSQWLIGELYAAQLDLDQALKAYYRVESLYQYPQWQAAALVQAGKCHELRGENADAARAWRQVLAKYSRSSYATEAAERLERLNAKLAAASAKPPVKANTSPPRIPPTTTGIANPASNVAPASLNVSSPTPSPAPRSARRRTISEP